MTGLSAADGRTRIVGVLNVTPDSFSDGGRYDRIDAAVEHGLGLVADGADVLDIGGESTRPGHQPVPAAEQIRRIVPVIAALRARVTVPISVDTTRAAVAAAALDAGADWVNDTSALEDDPELGPLCAARGCPVVLMHRFRPPRTPGDAPTDPRALAALVGERLAARVGVAVAHGIDRGRLILDPGVGFGTTPADAVALHAAVDALRAPGRPLLFGTSRKSFLGHLTGRSVGDRLAASAASAAILALAGVDYLRVHDVAAIRDVCAVADAVRRLRETVT